MMKALHCTADGVSADRSGRYDCCAPLQEGDVVGGKYLLLQPIGAGGMGQVWKARNSATGAEVAVKTLLPELASSNSAVARFQDEAHAIAQLSHRAIVRIFDLVERADEAGRPVIVMELLRGHTLAQRIAKQGPLSVAETLAVVLPLLSALAHAHGAGIIHRDVKPDNVFLVCEPDGQILPKLLDFGISQVRDWGGISAHGEKFAGTPWYMSPEQARGEDVDARCDVFGIGILLYECLSGRNPFRVEGETSSALQCWTPLPISGIPAGLWRAMSQALAARPDDRFASAEDFAATLLAVSAAPWRSFLRAGPRLVGLASLVCAISWILVLVFGAVSP